MTTTPWWQDAVIYQICPRSFADADGDGVGDLRGIIAHLDHLNDGTPNSLGVEAIWLSPIYPSPGYDFGYDVADYCDIDPLFGTLADFDLLVAEAHRRGIRVVMDMVVNHTSHEHPWFVESRASRMSPKRDWYIWHDARPGGGRPNKWESVFGGRAWEWDEATGQYYYHMFLKEQPDLNWRNPDVRRAVMQAFRFWLERGVDGFRLDVVNAYFKDADLRDNPSKLGIRGYDRQAHVYDMDRPELIAVYRELNTLLREYGEHMAVGEIMEATHAKVARYSAAGLLPLAFNFEFTNQPWRAGAFAGAIARCEAALGEAGWPCYVLSNHDVPRHVSRYGGRFAVERAKLAAAMLLTLRGTPFLYYGEEIGMRNGHIARAQIQDPPGKRYWPIYGGRDPERTPMPWSAEDGAGFTGGRPWLPINPDFRSINVAAQRDDPRSVFAWYRQLIWLRKSSVALRRGSYRTLLGAPRRAQVYLREAPGQTMLVALNFSPHRVQVQFDAPLRDGAWRQRAGTHAAAHERLHSEGMRLEPHEACILEAG
jgi:alpha-glucosidase